MIRIEFDGACEPVNPGGIATWGFVVYKDKTLIHEGSGIFSNSGTNNEAEFSAVLAGLSYLADQGLKSDKVKIQGDSSLVINCLRGRWKLKAKNLLPIFWNIQELEREFPEVDYYWIPREQNAHADAISRIPYDLAQEVQ